MSLENQKKFFYLLLTILWGYFIFYLSSVPNLSSGLATWQDLILRKCAHILVFAVLTYFLAKTFDRRHRLYLLFVVVISISYALVDEMHQLLVAGRSGQLLDVMIDALGVFLGSWFFILQHNKKISLKNKVK